MRRRSLRVSPRVLFNLLALFMYDHISYDRAEENELSFKEGDRITEIEAASEDWWQGKDSDGNIGLFPGKKTTKVFEYNAKSWTPSANYVEVQE